MLGRDGGWMIQRTSPLYSAGRYRAVVEIFVELNGRTTTLNQFRGLGQYLIDLHGQQEQQSAAQAWSARWVLLDSFCGRRCGSQEGAFKKPFSGTETRPGLSLSG